MSEKYSIEQKTVENILGYIRNEEIAIPEIQRPFVWSGAQVRDLIDSLYRGYPAGYLIVWQNPDVSLRDGSKSVGKKILIDGQQRVTAMMTAIDGREVLNDEYQLRRIAIAFNPWAEEGESNFEVKTPAHVKDKKWIPDISVLFASTFKSRQFENEYCENNPSVDVDLFSEKINKVREIVHRQLGVIMLDSGLGIDDVTEIFVRINSQGKELNEADFAMSKLAADNRFGGKYLRKAIDYFCHLTVAPTFWERVQRDKKYMESSFAKESEWLKYDSKEIYDPEYSDMLRVAMMHMFGRGKLKDLVALLSGRDFENRIYKDEIVESSFKQLTEGIHHFVKEYNFQQFVQAIETAGFISPKLLNSQITLDFAYTLYLYLQRTGEVGKQEIGHYVQKWFVMSTLTGRYIGSPESWMDRDLRAIKERGVVETLKELESAVLGVDFWENGLVQALETSAAKSPYLAVFKAAQVFFNEKSLLASTPVRNLIDGGDVHHIFPKNYLKRAGKIRSVYNQVANYTYLETPINIAIGDDPPCVYLGKAFQQCETKKPQIGLITDIESLKSSLKTNCIPEDIGTMDADVFETRFLPARRRLMAAKIRRYYAAL